MRWPDLVERALARVVERAWPGASPQLRHRVAGTVARGQERSTYERLVELGFAPDAVIDVGANRGDWSRLARRIFPTAAILMVEAQASLQPELEQACAEIGNAAYRLALLAPTEGESRPFYEMGTGSSMLAENSNVARTTAVLTTATLDSVVCEALSQARHPFLKLDVQGAELMVLQGGSETLTCAAAVQLETALLPYNAGAPLLAEVVAFMAEHDLLVTEIAGFSRPGKHLVQVDLVFARADSSLRPSHFIY